MVLSAIFNNMSAISWRKQEYPEKTINLSQVTDTPHYIMLYLVHHAMNNTLHFNAARMVTSVREG